MIYLNRFIRLFGGIEMSLLKCPECNHDVSEYAEVCPNCGCPIEVIKKYVKNEADRIKNNLPDKCPICGVNTKDHINDKNECDVCGYVYDKTKEELEEYLQKRKQLPDKCPVCYAPKEKIDDNFVCTVCGYVVLKDDTKQQNYIKRVDKSQIQSVQEQQNTPHCPVCNSTNIEKISLGKKAKGSILFGFLSSDVQKTMHCKNCGYKF